jgi:hypothetical protein
VLRTGRRNGRSDAFTLDQAGGAQPGEIFVQVEMPCIGCAAANEHRQK